MNTVFNHKELHKITWSNTRGQKSMIDYFMTSENATIKFTDVRIFRSLEVGSDHFFVQGEIHMNITERPAKKIEKRINT